MYALGHPLHDKFSEQRGTCLKMNTLFIHLLTTVLMDYRVVNVIVNIETLAESMAHIMQATSQTFLHHFTNLSDAL